MYFVFCMLKEETIFCFISRVFPSLPFSSSLGGVGCAAVEVGWGVGNSLLSAPGIRAHPKFLNAGTEFLVPDDVARRRKSRQRLHDPAGLGDVWWLSPFTGCTADACFQLFALAFTLFLKRRHAELQSSCGSYFCLSNSIPVNCIKANFHRSRWK